MGHVLTMLKVLPKTNHSEAVSLAQELGLELQANRYAKSLAEDVFKALTHDEVILWAHHCPTRYIPGGGEGVKKLESYAFDNVPLEVMRHWKAIKDDYAFDRYEIWTTEKTINTDPLLIGVLGQRLFLLARWGMESPEYLPLKEIAQRVYNDFCARSMKYKSRFESRESALAKSLEHYRLYYPYFSAAERILGKKQEEST